MENNKKITTIDLCNYIDSSIDEDKQQKKLDKLNALKWQKDWAVYHRMKKISHKHF